LTVAGHYTPDGRVRRFITKVALPKTSRRRRTSASSADGADLTREKAVEYPYSQVSLGFVVVVVVVVVVFLQLFFAAEQYRLA
jgi:hypothetical protein